MNLRLKGFLKTKPNRTEVNFRWLIEKKQVKMYIWSYSIVVTVVRVWTHIKQSLLEQIPSRRAYLHGGGGPQVGFDGIQIWSRLHNRWGDPPNVASTIWGSPSPCKQALKQPGVTTLVDAKAKVAEQVNFAASCGRVVGKLDLQIRGPEFKSR